MSFGQVMQKVVMGNPRRASLFLSKMPASFFEKMGRKKALSAFKVASERVPAYKRFLKEKGINPQSIKTFTDFNKLPEIDKKNYILKYPLEERCLDGNLYQAHTISASSGSTGKPTYWPRLPAQDEAVPAAIDLLYTEFMQMDKKPTLEILTLALGTWAAGEIAGDASRAVAKRRPFVVISPGLNLEETIRIIKDLSPKFEQTLLGGYPPFVKKTIEEGEERGIDWAKLNIRIMMGGEGVSEDWRSYVMQKIGVRDNDLTAVLNLFATAEGGILGFETPFTVWVRKRAHQDPKIREALFGGEEPISLSQFTPMGWYLEEQGGEILISKEGAVPLVRYNVHDRGGVLGFEKVLPTVFEDESEQAQFSYSIWKLPLFYTHGRSDAVKVGGANVYLENVQRILSLPFFQKITTGAFKMGSYLDEQKDQRLKLKFELRPGVVASAQLEQEFSKRFVEELRLLNTEYNSSFKAAARSSLMIPNMELCPTGDQRYFTDNRIKNKYFL